jgi:hypothetical protein
MSLMTAGPFHPYVGGIMNFVKTCWIDEERTDQFAASALGLIGDFAETYGANVREYVLQDWVSQAISYGRQRTSSKKARANASYATQVSPLYDALLTFLGYQSYSQIDRTLTNRSTFSSIYFSVSPASHLSHTRPRSFVHGQYRRHSIRLG